MTKRDIFVVIAFFYSGWFGAVLLAPTKYANASLIFPLSLAVYLLVRNQFTTKTVYLTLAISALGIFFDSLLLRFGYISAYGGSEIGIPIWLVSIWLLFSLSTVKLGTLIKLPIWTVALLGLVFGPLSYKSGEVFNVLTLTSPTTILIYALFWALVFPATIISAKRFT